ncbi:hypothetical protein [Campylobacter sputorum]|uniref:hypothetical protein n=1 Tax=Campylobacter sputorum TaxID=206 RepID=UPI00053BE90C|nr:hypothetical protein [Campylobacter sputorum]
MTDEQLRVYNYGLKKLREDEIWIVKSKVSRLKNELLISLNKPMELKVFREICDELCQNLTHLEKLERNA